MLKDVGLGTPRPYSYARVQLTWWTLIVLSSVVSIYIVTGQFPDLWPSTLYLLGISSATTATGTVIDLNDKSRYGSADANLVQNESGKNMIYDILTDKNDVSIHRLQAVVFNFTLGFWYIQQVLHNMPAITDKLTAMAVNKIMPDVPQNNLILIGLSAGVYAGLKTTENKQPQLAAMAKTTGEQDPVTVTQKIG